MGMWTNNNGQQKVTVSNLAAEMKKCTTLNEMWRTLDKVYNLDKELGFIKRDLVAKKLQEYAQELANQLGIPKRE